MNQGLFFVFLPIKICYVCVLKMSRGPLTSLADVQKQIEMNEKTSEPVTRNQHSKGPFLACCQAYITPNLNGPPRR